MIALACALAATFGATLIVIGAYSVRLYGRLHDALDGLDELAEQRDQDSELIAELRHEGEMKDVAMSDLLTRLRRITAQHQKDKEQGEKAAIAGMEILRRERDGFLESLQSWQFIASVSLAMITRAPPAAIEAPRRKPLALPSGDFLVHDRLILPADDEDAGFTYWAAEPLPTGTNGTRDG